MRAAAKKIRNYLMDITRTEKNRLPGEISYGKKKLEKTQEQFSPLMHRYDIQ